ncbi:PAS domain-containing hybrid sensor histidine kinase/response regulator [Aquamicrobium lusatiense]|uniref:hybrid sensor histidine kinase/response regulator n=1 Tax=Aquamicrobium lusatiense TaxID=89772 RepID=UPI002458D260|nr:PAS domain-containing hybrid sensor histidine kinase/response regulator [Aquamicrobium lusatiense]MDH4992119.1 PAS domain-containing hybrid sensor histidine kinase/response regulator [Aquamicrobium lusatiense]
MLGWLIVIAAILYVTMLFAVAAFGDRHAARRGPIASRPYIYSLSLAVYCTSWTFFGSVGLASERGLEFLTIYAGPILIFIFGYPFLKRIITLSKAEKITSIADFLAARYGKSFAVASIATIIATVGVIPYIALQLRSIAGSIGLMVAFYSPDVISDAFVYRDVAFVVAFLLAVFAVLFGTRHADATEHQDGLVLAMAVESVIKLAAFLAVGVAITLFLLERHGNLFEFMHANDMAQAAMAYETTPATWIVMTLLAAAAIIMLPRQFYMTIVENRSDQELKTSGWLFPLYLVLINLFVVVIAFGGLAVVGEGASADLYVLAVPLFHGQNTMAMIAFIGGLSAATAMVIVESVALSIMISNDLVIPLVLRRLLRSASGEREDWSKVIIVIRRAAIFSILFISFLYYLEMADNVRLVAFGLISFAAVAQFAPAFVGGLIWRGANARGAVLGMIAGILTWAYTLFIPSLFPADTAFLVEGPLGIAALRPQSLFGTSGEPLTHGVLWSLSINLAFYILGSLSRASYPRERIQAAIFVPRETGPMPGLRRMRTSVTINEVKDTIARYLGVERTERSFQSFEQREGRSFPGHSPATDEALRFGEQLLASAVGSSSARLILSLLVQRHDRSAKRAFRLLDDASDALQQNRDLLQIALDQMEQGITVFDKDLRLTCWNRQYRLLFDLPDEMGQVGISLTQILGFLGDRGDISGGEEMVALDRLTRFAEPWQLELRTSGRILELRSNPMPDGGIVATYADITRRMQADLALKRVNETLEQRVARRTAELTQVNEELAQAQKIAEEANLGKTRFLAAVGHDILQPLNAARLYCSSLIEKAPEGPLGDAAVNIESSLESVETILGAVLDISRLDAGAMKPDETVFSLDGLLQQIATDFQPMASAKGLRLRIVPSRMHVRTDRNLFRRLVQNLVSNAVKYTRRGTVLVGARRRGSLIELQVIDTGIGIGGDKLNTVFREFMRLDEGVREADGLGLGLSIVDRIARVLHLEIRIFSLPGKGTRFSVILPVVTGETARPVRCQTPTQRTFSTLAGLSILCIDNDPRILEGMRLLLEGWGCEVRAFSGLRAFMSARGRLSPPDIILADYHLDGENGLDAIDRLREVYGPETPAVLVTADRSTEVRGEAERRGVTVINKPVKPAALRTMLSRVRPLAVE